MWMIHLAIAESIKWPRLLGRLDQIFQIQISGFRDY